MEEDDMDFIPSSNTSSNLASLFGFTKKPLQGNSSLTYTAPRAPKKELNPGKRQCEEKTKGKIIFSKAVQAYKLENRAYVNQGLIGIVISGNYDSHTYEIILYKRSKEHLSQIIISGNFSITLSPNNYISFYDNNKQNWSVMFQSPEDVEQFSQKIAICKFYSQAEPSTDILIQDLGPASQQKTSPSSVVEIIYNVYTLTPEELKTLRGEIKEKIKLSDYNFTHLSKGLIGCPENCKRVILIPHSLGGPWLNELGPYKDLMIEVKVEKIVIEENLVSELKLHGNKPSESPIDSSTEETNIKARGVSIKEALASTKFQKANLISRMARMGQATLPVKQGLSAGPSDSEEENSVASFPKLRWSKSKNTSANPPQNNSFSQTQNLEASQQLSVYPNDLSWQQAQLSKLGFAEIRPYQQLIPVTSSTVPSPTTEPNLSVYVSESRIQAAELRMGISKLSEKIDLIWSKIQNLNEVGIENKAQQALMDSGGILTSIQNLITENENLKEKVEKQKGKIEQQNDRIFHLLELNHKYLEQNSTTHEKQSANELKLKAEVEMLQKKELELEGANKIALDRVKNLEGELAKSAEVNKELKKRVEELDVETEGMKKNFKGSNDEKAKKFNDLKEKMSKASETIIKLEEKLKSVAFENENLKCIIKTQKEEIESGGQEMMDSKTKNREYEKAVETLKKQISEEESKTESKIENLSKAVSKLEEENKYLLEKIEKENDRKESENLFPQILEVIKDKFSDSQEYSAARILTTIEEIFNNVVNGTFKYEQKSESLKIQSLGTAPAVVPAPRTSLQNIEPLPPEENESQTRETEENSSLKECERKEEDKQESKIQKKKNEVDSRYKSYDQGWRTTKPPPPPLFDDDDDDDDWLN